MKHHVHSPYIRNRRTLRLESLERRDLLSAVPLSASEYAALTEQYSSLSLPETMDDLNVITLDLSEGDDINSLKSAIAEAGQTTASDLIVVRTTDTANTLTWTSSSDELKVNIDSTQYGTLTIVGLGDTSLILNANSLSRHMSVSGENTALNLANLSMIGGKTSVMGGAIHNIDGYIALENCEIRNNITEYELFEACCGGGIYNQGKMLLSECNISENTVKSTTQKGKYAKGGGIYNINEMKLVDCLISDNKAEGTARNGIGDASGGGIYNTGNLTIIKGIIRSNTAYAGATVGSAYANAGGIMNSGNLILTLCDISENLVQTYNTTRVQSGGWFQGSNSSLGGGISNAGTLIANSSNFFNNETWADNEFASSYTSRGGGISTSGNVLFADCIISGNISNKDAGGIYCSSGELWLMNCDIVDNTAKMNGGGIYSASGIVAITNSTLNRNKAEQNGGGIYNTGNVSVTNCKITENIANAGGAILNNTTNTSDSNIEVLNSLIFKNMASSDLGAIYNNSGNITITNVTLTDNECGGVINKNGTAKLYNTIVINNGQIDISGTVEGSNNLTSFQNWSAGENNLMYNADLPLFADWQKENYALAVKSQVLNRGNNFYVASANIQIGKDIAGNTRIQCNVIDIGAYEGTVIDTTVPTVKFDQVNDIITSKTFTLSWHGQDSDSGVAFYKLYIAKNGSDFELLEAELREAHYTYIFTEDGEYTFKIIAKDNVNLESIADEIRFGVDTTAPTVILGEVPTQTEDEEIQLTWMVDEFASCEVWVSKDDAAFVKAAEYVTDGWFTFAFDGDGRYAFKVTAVDEVGNRAESEVVSVKKWTEPEPSVSAVVSGNRVKVVWENDGPEADSVWYREAGTQRWTVRKLKAGVSEFAFNGRAGKEYEIQVLCGQQEDRILTESVILLVSPKMKAERNSVTDEGFTVNVSNWAGQLHECASMVYVTLNGERQEIALENGHGSCVFSGGETAGFADGVLRFGNVKSNFQHTVRVAFSNGESTSAVTSPLRIRTAMAAYDAPVIESVEALDGKSVCVTWTTAYGKDSTQAAKYYTVQYSTDGERWRTAATRAEGNAFILTNLKGQTQYLVSVFATRDRDFSASVPSESVLVKTAFPTPTITSARSNQAGRAVISWKSGSGAAQYELAWRETGSSEWKSILVPSSDAKVAFTLFGLTSGKGCEFRVRALPLDTTVNASAWSGIKSVKKVS